MFLLTSLNEISSKNAKRSGSADAYLKKNAPALEYRRNHQLLAANSVYRDCWFYNIDQLQTRLIFNELWSSTLEIQVNTGKYVIKQD